MQVGAVLRAEKNRAFGAAIAQFFRQKMREFVANSLQILCAVDAQRTKTSAGVAAKTF